MATQINITWRILNNILLRNKVKYPTTWKRSMLLPNVKIAQTKERVNSFNRLHGASESDNPNRSAYIANNLPILYWCSCNIEKQAIPNKMIPTFRKSRLSKGIIVKTPIFWYELKDKKFAIIKPITDAKNATISANFNLCFFHIYNSSTSPLFLYLSSMNFSASFGISHIRLNFATPNIQFSSHSFYTRLTAIPYFSPLLGQKYTQTF